MICSPLENMMTIKKHSKATFYFFTQTLDLNQGEQKMSYAVERFALWFVLGIQGWENCLNMFLQITSLK